ncbi:MAG: hypothetical protein ACJ8IR_11915 [Alphaproteobacteria bacterium]|jgi:hypothetical protein
MIGTGIIAAGIAIHIAIGRTIDRDADSLLRGKPRSVHVMRSALLTISCRAVGPKAN